MFRKIIIPFILLLLMSLSSLNAQSQTKTFKPKVRTTYAEYLGTTAEIRHLIPLPSTDPEKRRRSKLRKKTPNNFPGRTRQEVLYPELTYQGPDPVRQSSIDPKSSIPIEPLLNIEGLFDPIGSPHDPSGDAGKSHYLQAINVTNIGVFDKAGTLLNTFSGNTLWQSLGFTSAGDPIILYDQTANRWVITEFPDPNQLLVAVSKTSDPQGSYDVWNFATPEFPDYPKYGVWSNAYSVTTNEAPPGPGIHNAYFIDREAMLRGEELVRIQRLELPGNINTEAGFFVATPVDWSGKTPPASDPIILSLNDSSWGDSAEDAIEIYSVNIDWDNPDNTTVLNTSVVTAPYDSYACADVGASQYGCIPQRGGIGIDGIPETILNQAHYRNFGTHESMVFNFMTDVDGNELAGIRWVELRKTASTNWDVYQEGTFAPDDGLHRFMGSIAMDGEGNIGLAYNVSSPSDFVGVRFTGRLASDELGKMTVDEYVVANGENAISSFGRFGDYAHMTIDPSNDRTFWFTTEYAAKGNVRTRILSFELQQDQLDIYPAQFVGPVSSQNLSNSETIEVLIRNRGIDPVSSFQLGYSIDGAAPVIENVNTTIMPGGSYQHAFATKADFSIVKTYQVLLFTDLNGDLLSLNDTICPSITKLALTDAAILGFQDANKVICGETAEIGINLTNLGINRLTSALIKVEFNGASLPDIDWTGSLRNGESETIPLTLTNLVPGMNELEVNVSNPNGQTDQILTNNSYSTSIQVLEDGVPVVVTINTDEYPEETSWEIRDGTGAIIALGGPYPGSLLQRITEEICLPKDSCFTFTIFDSAQDGICCDFGSGNYSIVDGAGEPLLTGDGIFESEKQEAFCTSPVCNLDVEIASSPESAPGKMDGVILLTVFNGIGPLMYSIDGGATFQPGNTFSGLGSGDYQILVSDSLSCEYTQTITLGLSTSAKELLEGGSVSLFPNPNDGIFKVDVEGLESGKVFLPIVIYDASGKMIYETQLVKYDGVYTKRLSLYAFPDGVYFLKFKDDRFKSMLRIVKQ